MCPHILGFSNCWTGFSIGTWNWNMGLEHWTWLHYKLQERCLNNLQWRKVIASGWGIYSSLVSPVQFHIPVPCFIPTFQSHVPSPHSGGKSCPVIRDSAIFCHVSYGYDIVAVMSAMAKTLWLYAMYGVVSLPDSPRGEGTITYTAIWSLRNFTGMDLIGRVLLNCVVALNKWFRRSAAIVIQLFL